MSAGEEVFMVNDPVHGSIELRGREIRLIIDTPEFQRLRKIKQLGGACYVYPGANHTRFEHSIGVCYIACELMEHLGKHDPKFTDKKFTKVTKPNEAGKLEVDVDYVKCVKLAALCHDLGHGPYSHLYDMAIKEEFQECSDQTMDHEYRSVKIFEEICKTLNERQDFRVTPAEIGVIGGMITFSNDYKDSKKTDVEVLQDLKIDVDKACFYEVVANGFTGIDVDKMDYFIRDGHYLGLSSFFDWKRYIHTLRVLEIPDHESEGKLMTRLCSRDKEVYELYQLFHIRTQLYRQAYYHKTTVGVERMIKDALKAANKAKVNGEIFLQAWNDPELFVDSVFLTDSIEDMIIMEAKKSSNRRSSIFEAKNIYDRIKTRQLMKFIGELKVMNSIKKEDLNDIIANTKKKCEDKLGQDMCRSFEIIHEVKKFSYGKGKDDPVKKHYFYKKPAPGDSPKPELLSAEQISQILPRGFLDRKVFFYLKKRYAPDSTNHSSKCDDSALFADLQEAIKSMKRPDYDDLLSKAEDVAKVISNEDMSPKNGSEKCAFDLLKNEVAGLSCQLD